MMFYSKSTDHEGNSTRNNRAIKEQVRAGFQALPYTKLPKVLIPKLVMDSAKKINFFQPRGGISKVYSPRMILHQENLDFDQHCAYPFGTYLPADDDKQPENSMHPYTLDCITYRYRNTPKTDASHIPRDSVHKIPVTQKHHRSTTGRPGQIVHKTIKQAR